MKNADPSAALRMTDMDKEPDIFKKPDTCKERDSCKEL
jgi:hypothetical protein